MRYEVIILVLLFAFNPIHLFGQSGKHSDKVEYLLEQINLSLVKNDLCKDVKRCNLAYYSSSSNSIRIEIYEINNSLVIKEILSLLTSSYYKYQEKISLQLKIYKNTKKENMGMFRHLYKSPYLIFKLEGEEK